MAVKPINNLADLTGEHLTFVCEAARALGMQKVIKADWLVGRIATAALDGMGGHSDDMRPLFTSEINHAIGRHNVAERAIRRERFAPDESLAAAVRTLLNAAERVVHFHTADGMFNIATWSDLRDAMDAADVALRPYIDPDMRIDLADDLGRHDETHDGSEGNPPTAADVIALIRKKTGSNNAVSRGSLFSWLDSFGVDVAPTKTISDYLNHDDEPADRIAAVIKFDNGNHAVFDGRGKQIPDLQQHGMLPEVERLADAETKWTQ